MNTASISPDTGKYRVRHVPDGKCPEFNDKEGVGKEYSLERNK